MASHKTLTNEQLKKNYNSPFALVNQAIELAAGLIARDEDHEYNPANRAIEMLAKGQILPPLPSKEKKEEEEDS